MTTGDILGLGSDEEGGDAPEEGGADKSNDYARKGRSYVNYVISM